MQTDEKKVDASSEVNNLETIEKNLMQKMSEGFNSLMEKIGFTEKTTKPNEEKPTEKPAPKEEITKLQATNDDDYKKLYEKNLEVESENKKLREEMEMRAEAEKRAAEKKLVETINNDIKELISHRVIASDDKEEIEDWKADFNDNYDRAKRRANKQIKEAQDKHGTDAVSMQKKQKLTAAAISEMAIRDAVNYINTREFKSSYIN
jgi:hypothetical protein